MTSSRKKPGVEFWATVVVVTALVGYPLGFGPAFRLARYIPQTLTTVNVIYRPLWAIATDDLGWPSRILASYFEVWYGAAPLDPGKPGSSMHCAEPAART
jgi:hypothetical protein